MRISVFSIIVLLVVALTSCTKEVDHIVTEEAQVVNVQTAKSDGLIDDPIELRIAGTIDMPLELRIAGTIDMPLELRINAVNIKNNKPVPNLSLNCFNDQYNHKERTNVAGIIDCSLAQGHTYSVTTKLGNHPVRVVDGYVKGNEITLAIER